MVIDTVAVDSLTPDPDNRRLHSEENIRAIYESLRQFGQVLPLVVHNGVVVGGNGTLKAMGQLGMEAADVTTFTGSKEDARALAIALNRSAELADWDVEALGQDLAELSGLGYMPDNLGFDEAALEALFPPTDTEFRIDTPPGDDEEPAAGIGNSAVQYTLIFDDGDQQKRFFEFMELLKRDYVGETNAGRLDQFIVDILADD